MDKCHVQKCETYFAIKQILKGMFLQMQLKLL